MATRVGVLTNATGVLNDMDCTGLVGVFVDVTEILEVVEVFVNDVTSKVLSAWMLTGVLDESILGTNVSDVEEVR